MARRNSKFIALLMMALWALAFGWLARYLWHVTQRLWAMQDVWLGFAVLLFAVISAYLCLCCLRIAARVARGKTSPRLAARELRNSMANMAFFFKSGGMLKDP